MKTYLDTDDDYSNRFYQDENVDVSLFVQRQDAVFDQYDEGNYDDDYDPMWDEDE